MNLKKLFNWASNLSDRYLLLTAFVSYLIFFEIVIFVFFPTEALIDATGYTIVYFQQAWTPGQMDLILTAWSSSIQAVVTYQLWADFVFIISGLLGNASLLLFFSKNVSGSWKRFSWGKIISVGLFATGISHSADMIENIFGLLIIYNPGSYITIFVPFQSLFSTIKFVTMPFIYFILVIALFGFLYQRTIQKNTIH